MKISILTVFPDLYNSFLQTSLVRRAQEADLIKIQTHGFMSFVPPKQRIDSPTFGPSAGMLIRPDVVEKAVEEAEKQDGKAFKIFFSPHGKKLDQPLLQSLADRLQQQKHLMLIPARYEGMDARVEQYYADEIISMGDFVLMGGDIPAMMLMEGLLRLIPGVIGKQESIERESFRGPFVDHPEYTAPVDWKGMQVPEIVRSGHHAAIEAWRQEQAAERTVFSHFSWLRSTKMTQAERKLAKKYIPNHYVVLMHSEVMVKGQDQIGTTSVTSLDIHDIARSAKTYGLAHYFIVTPLRDQQHIVQTLLDFWQKGGGFAYNESRFEAVKQVSLLDSLDQVIADIEKKEGKKPLLVVTSAREMSNIPTISYEDQAVVWAHKRPVLLILGTGGGLSQELMERCDYRLMPIVGFSDYNHLSVRSAAAVIFDRWLGLNDPSRH
jgi:tRNA (guanine37-N1)-methyltransferase